MLGADVLQVVFGGVANTSELRWWRSWSCCCGDIWFCLVRLVEGYDE